MFCYKVVLVQSWRKLKVRAKTSCGYKVILIQCLEKICGEKEKLNI